tara:strand:- start:381 stop:593 length:213 start_codon:yes stop_codon:yes gene_type:complete
MYHSRTSKRKTNCDCGCGPDKNKVKLKNVKKYFEKTKSKNITEDKVFENGNPKVKIKLITPTINYIKKPI